MAVQTSAIMVQRCKCAILQWFSKKRPMSSYNNTMHTHGVGGYFYRESDGTTVWIYEIGGETEEVLWNTSHDKCCDREAAVL